MKNEKKPRILSHLITKIKDRKTKGHSLRGKLADRFAVSTFEFSNHSNIEEDAMNRRLSTSQTFSKLIEDLNPTPKHSVFQQSSISLSRSSFRSTYDQPNNNSNIIAKDNICQRSKTLQANLELNDLMQISKLMRATSLHGSLTHIFAPPLTNDLDR